MMVYYVIIYKYLVCTLRVVEIDELYLPAALLLTTEPTVTSCFLTVHHELTIH